MTIKRASFETWKRAADAACFAECGLGIDDLPDLTPLHDWYTQGMSAITAAKRAVRAAKKEYGF